MIEKLIPLTKNKIDLLKAIYEAGETHLLDIARRTKLHPFSVKRSLSGIKYLLNEKKAGKTILLSIDKNQESYLELAGLIERYRLNTGNKKVNSAIKHIRNLFSEENIILCCLFGSYARLAFAEKSDIDLLLVAKQKNKEIIRNASRLSTVLGKTVNPLILTEEEFHDMIKNKEPSIMTLKTPAQRLLVKGAEYFVRSMETG
ncbi:MAG: nucleotidyltransferase domain-containing protein [Nanoarchaeota archaeon]|nr:nucleotidyltransferase domain-containing protein [Nanoarchaeota archaeon]